jgi:ribosome production factor 2
LKNDAAIILMASHSKKRPHNLTITRTFDNQMLDIVELGIINLKAMEEYDVAGVAMGNRPLTIFNGDAWDEKPEYETLRSVFLDLYTGDTSAEMLDLRGISHLIAFSLNSKGTKPKVKMTVYKILLKKSGTKIPLVDLEEIGPFIEFELRRFTLANSDMMKDAMKAPKLGKVILNVILGENSQEYFSQ